MAGTTPQGSVTPRAASSTVSSSWPSSFTLRRMSGGQSSTTAWQLRPPYLTFSRLCADRHGFELRSRFAPVLRPSCSCFLRLSPALEFRGSHRKFRFAVQAKQQTKGGTSAPASKVQEDLKAINEEENSEGEISWIQEKGEDIAFYASTAVQAIPGPRVGESGLPWLLAVPLAYAAITFVLATVKTIRKFNSPKAKRRRQIGQNVYLNESLSEYLPSKRLELTSVKLMELAKKCNFSTSEILRKYIRYALNERPFNTDVVADLIHLKKVGSIADTDVAEILNDVSRRIVKAKGVVVMDTTGFTAKGLERKIAVQALFKKLLYLSELEDFCPASARASLQIKEIFGVTDEDADSIRFDTLSELSDMDTLERMVSSGSDADNEEG